MKILIFATFIFCDIGRGFSKIPDYIKVCKRDQSTINECVRNSIEALRPKLAEGIPELNVPALEPFYIPEIIVDSGNLASFHAVGKDVKVTGAGNFLIKNINVDLDTYIMRARVRFPKLHFDGHYKLDAQLVVMQLHGQGNISADAVKCNAELTLRGEVVDRDGAQYLVFNSLNMDINVKDYTVRLDGLFNGDQALGEAANLAINQNRGEFLKASKPFIEKTTSKILLDAANKIANSFPLDDLLPKS